MLKTILLIQYVMITGYLETKADPMTHFHFYFFEDFFKEKRGKEIRGGVYSLGARCNSSQPSRPR